MGKRRLAKTFGVLLSAVFIISIASVSLAADDFQRFGIRLRGIYIIPDERFDSRLDSLNLKLKSAATPELDLEYFFTRNFSGELVLALSKHDISRNGSPIGSLWLLPPSLFAKYNFLPNAVVRPYVGLGMNIVVPFDEHLSLNGGATKTNFHVEDSIGWAAKVGFDIPITKNVFINLDAMYYNTETKMKIGTTRYDLGINPFILGAGIGIRF